MKKILAILLALCLVLSLSVTAFANGSVQGSVEGDKPGENKPQPVNPNPGAAGGSSANGANNSTTGKFVYTVTTASGTPLTADIQAVASGDIYDEIKAAGVVAMYYISITSAVSPDEVVEINVYAPGVNSDCAVVVRDAWEVLPDVTMTANGNRATITGPAGVFNTWHYVAIVSNADSDVIVNVPQEGTEQGEEGEEVDETPVVNVDETPEDNAPAANDANPGTGIALAVVPMIVAAAAVVVSKKR